MENEKEVDVIGELDKASAEQLTELERTKMENFVLKHTLTQQQLQNIINERTAYIRQIEAAHPGYVWDEQKGLVAA